MRLQGVVRERGGGHGLVTYTSLAFYLETWGDNRCPHSANLMVLDRGLYPFLHIHMYVIEWTCGEQKGSGTSRSQPGEYAAQ